MIPWGFMNTGRGLVCKVTAAERIARAELGETAILLCTQLGIEPAHLEALRQVLRAKGGEWTYVPPATADSPTFGPPEPPNLVEALEGLRAEA